MIRSIRFAFRVVLYFLFMGIFSGVLCAQTVQLSGRVIDAQGKCLKDAYVLLYEISSDQTGLHIARDLLGRSKSDADGRFCFVREQNPSVGKEAVVLAAMENRCIRWASWDMAANKEVVLTLGDYGKISGIVQDVEGRPLGNAPIRALLKIPSPEDKDAVYCFDRLAKTTDASGRFTFDFIPKDAVAEFYVESAGKISFYGEIRNFNELPFQYKPGDQNVLISVCEESSVSGVVMGPDGQPAAGVEVMVSGWFTGNAAKTDSNGKFHVDHLTAGMCLIALNCSEVNASWAAEPQQIFLGRGEKAGGITFHIKKAGMITFTVQDAQSGQKISDCYITLTKKGNSFGIPFLKQGDGNKDSLTYRVSAGSYSYNLSADGYYFLFADKEILVREGESVPVTVKLEPLPRVAGVVRTPQGGEAGEAKIKAFPGGYGTAANSKGEFKVHFHAESNEENAWIYCEDLTGQYAAIQAVSKDKPSVTIQLRKTLPLKGRVVNENGNGIAEATVYLYFIDSQNNSHLLHSDCKTDSYGNYSVPNAVPGCHYQIMVHDRSQRASSPIFGVTSGLAVMPLDTIKLGITRIAGQVVDGSSRPVGGATVLFYDVVKSRKFDSGFEVKPAGEVVCDSSGHYLIELKGARDEIDHSFVMVSKPEYATNIELYNPDEPTIKTVILSSDFKTFSGVIKDSAGNPVPGASVSAYVSEYQKDYSDYVFYDIAKEAAGTRGLSAVTGQDGVFVIPNIPSYAKGEFVIRAQGYATLYTGKSATTLEDMTIPAGKSGLAFVLERMSGIRGIVVDQETNKPITGEKVFISRKDQAPEEQKTWNWITGTHALKTASEDKNEYITDDKGCFQGSLAPGSYHVMLDPFSATTRQWTAEVQDVEIGEGQNAEVKITAVRLGTIAVTVIDHQKQDPIAGATVYIVPASSVSNTVENTKPKTLPTRSITWVPAGGSLEEDGQVMTRLDDDSSKEDVVPVKTDDQGKAVFHVAPGKYSIKKIVKKYYEYTAGNELLEAASGGSRQITVTMKSLPGICGVCRDTAGRPVMSAEIREPGSLELLAVTDGQGWFQFDPTALKQQALPSGITLIAFQPQMQLGGWGRVVSSRTNTLELGPAVLILGQIADPAGNPIPDASIQIVSTEQYLSQGSERRPETKLVPFVEVNTDLFGKFSLLVIPDLSYVIQIAADGYGCTEETIVNIEKSSYRATIYNDTNDCFIDKTKIVGNGPEFSVSCRVWRFRSGKDKIDLGVILLPALDQTLSGVVVDRMGNPLKGYNVTVEGKDQPESKTSVSDQSGRFQLDGLCRGLVTVSGTNGTYKVFKRWVPVGGTLRLVSEDHPVSSKFTETRTDNSLCDLEVVLIDQDTQEPIHYEKASIDVSSEEGGRFGIKPDGDGRYLARVKEGKYTIHVNAYPRYQSKNDVDIVIKTGEENKISIPLKIYPAVEGVIHLPDSVDSEQIEIDIQPNDLLTIYEDDFEIAGDGQFSCKISLIGEMPTHAWLWIRTKDQKYVSVTKIPLNNTKVEISLVSEAAVKFKKSDRYYSVTTWSWVQEEYKTWAAGERVKKEIAIDEKDYMGVHGLVAGQEDLTYIFTIVNVLKPIKVHSKDLKPGQTTIIEIPSN